MSEGKVSPLGTISSQNEVKLYPDQKQVFSTSITIKPTKITSALDMNNMKNDIPKLNDLTSLSSNEKTVPAKPESSLSKAKYRKYLNIFEESLQIKKDIGQSYYEKPVIHETVKKVEEKKEVEEVFNNKVNAFKEEIKEDAKDEKSKTKDENEPIELDQETLEDIGFNKSDEYIILKSRKIASIDPYTFRGWRNIEAIYLYDNLLTKIDHGTFNSLKNLNTLSFEFNSINQIDAGIFSNLANLQYLKLNCNQIKSIDKSAFYGLYNLKSLDLSNNVIKTIDKSTFGDLINLVSLYMNNNLIKSIDVTTFSSLVCMKMLDLHGNFIDKFEETTFKGALSLKYLDISDNPLESFDGNLEEFNDMEINV